MAAQGGQQGPLGGPSSPSDALRGRCCLTGCSLPGTRPVACVPGRLAIKASVAQRLPPANWLICDTHFREAVTQAECCVARCPNHASPLPSHAASKVAPGQPFQQRPTPRGVPSHGQLCEQHFRLFSNYSMPSSEPAAEASPPVAPAPTISASPAAPAAAVPAVAPPPSPAAPPAAPAPVQPQARSRKRSRRISDSDDGDDGGDYEGEGESEATADDEGGSEPKRPRRAVAVLSSDEGGGSAASGPAAGSAASQRVCWYRDCSKADRTLRLPRPFLVHTCKTHANRVDAKLAEAHTCGRLQTNEGLCAKDNVCGICGGLNGSREMIACSESSCAFAFCRGCVEGMMSANTHTPAFDIPPWPVLVSTQSSWVCWVCQAVSAVGDQRRQRERPAYVRWLIENTQPAAPQGPPVTRRASSAASTASADEEVSDSGSTTKASGRKSGTRSALKRDATPKIEPTVPNQAASPVTPAISPAPTPAAAGQRTRTRVSGASGKYKSEPAMSTRSQRRADDALPATFSLAEALVELLRQYEENQSAPMDERAAVSSLRPLAAKLAEMEQLRDKRADDILGRELRELTALVGQSIESSTAQFTPKLGPITAPKEPLPAHSPVDSSDEGRDIASLQSRREKLNQEGESADEDEEKDTPPPPPVEANPVPEQSKIADFLQATNAVRRKAECLLTAAEELLAESRGVASSCATELESIAAETNEYNVVADKLLEEARAQVDAATGTQPVPGDQQEEALLLEEENRLTAELRGLRKRLTDAGDRKQSLDAKLQGLQEQYNERVQSSKVKMRQHESHVKRVAADKEVLQLLHVFANDFSELHRNLYGEILRRALGRGPLL